MPGAPSHCTPSQTNAKSNGSQWRTPHPLLREEGAAEDAEGAREEEEDEMVGRTARTKPAKLERAEMAKIMVQPLHPIKSPRGTVDGSVISRREGAVLGAETVVVVEGGDRPTLQHPLLRRCLRIVLKRMV